MRSSLKSLGVLIVDDDPMLLRTMADVLTLRGYAPDTARSGKHAIELAILAPPAVAVVDLRLPDMDGLDLIARLQAESALTEVVVLTGNASVSSAVRAVREQIFDYLLKPVAPDQLVATLERAGERWRRRSAEAALAVSEHRFRSLIEHASDPIAVLDEDSRIQYATPAWEHVMGFRADALLGRKMIDWVHSEDLPMLQEGLALLLQTRGSTTPLTLRFRHRDGTWKTLAGTAKNLLYEAGIGGIVLNAHDITAMIDLETQLRHVQKMEAIGQLAGGIAHDFNNILTVIVGYADILLREMPAVDPHTADVGEIRNAADRATQLTRQILAFSRKQFVQPRRIDLNVLIGQIEPMLRRLLGEQVQWRTSFDAALGTTLADPGQIEQVLMNLVVNARDAMPINSEGTLSIETRNASLDAEYANRYPDVKPGPYVMLAVTDNGSGMDAATRQRIFEPFFTTKPVDRGTGLGLSVVYGIVKQSGGHIWVYSELGIGTSFKVYLPRRDDGVEWLPEQPLALDGIEGTEMVLVVEDETPVRDFVRASLERYGYRTLAASDIESALEIARDHDEAIDLVISDVVLPGRSGTQGMAALHAIRPGMPVLFMSGYPSDAVSWLEVPDSWRQYLEKPFTQAKLLGRVRQMLDAKTAAT